MNIPAHVAFLMTLALCVPGDCFGSKRISLEPLNFNDEFHDCELVLYPAGSPDTPILQIPLYEKPVAVIRRLGQRQELKIDETLWRSVSTYSFGPGRHSIELYGHQISITATFTLTRGTSCYVPDGTCMSTISNGLIKIVAPRTDREEIRVRGAIGC